MASSFTSQLGKVTRALSISNQVVGPLIISLGMHPEMPASERRQEIEDFVGQYISQHYPQYGAIAPLVISIADAAVRHALDAHH